MIYYIVTQDNRILMMGQEGLKLWSKAQIKVFTSFSDADTFRKICLN